MFFGQCRNLGPESLHILLYRVILKNQHLHITMPTWHIFFLNEYFNFFLLKFWQSFIKIQFLIETEGGNSQGAPCVIPFFFGGYNHWSCIPLYNGETHKWCATTDNFHDDGLWGICILDDPSITTSAPQGNLQYIVKLTLKQTSPFIVG